MDSLVNQTMREIEIILVDDVSPDGSKRFRLYYVDTNIGNAQGVAQK